MKLANDIDLELDIDFNAGHDMCIMLIKSIGAYSTDYTTDKNSHCHSGNSQWRSGHSYSANSTDNTTDKNSHYHSGN